VESSHEADEKKVSNNVWEKKELSWTTGTLSEGKFRRRKRAGFVSRELIKGKARWRGEGRSDFKWRENFSSHGGTLDKKGSARKGGGGGNAGEG